MTTTIRAADHVRPGASIVATAEAVSRAVVDALRFGGGAQVDLSGMRGVPSTFFNVILLGAVNAVGLDAVDRHLEFVFETRAQHEVFDRSLKAVRESPRFRGPAPSGCA
jgi:hypothetical protein